MIVGYVNCIEDLPWRFIWRCYWLTLPTGGISGHFIWLIVINVDFIVCLGKICEMKAYVSSYLQCFVFKHSVQNLAEFQVIVLGSVTHNN